MFVKRLISMRQQGMKCADAVYRNGPKHCPDTKEDPLKRLAATKYSSLYLPLLPADGRSGCLVLCGGDSKLTEGKM